jgi:hypothetical protein
MEKWKGTECGIKANANPFAAHDPSIKRRPSCQLFMGFAVKIIHILFRQTFIILTLFNYWRRYFLINELFRK